MTTIIGIQGEGWAVLGCDSRTSEESGRHLVTPNPKIINNNGILIAGSGASRGSNILQFGYVVPKPKAGQNLDEYISRVFIPRMHDEFKKAGYDMKEDGDVAQQDSAFFVCVRGVIYPIWQDYSWDTDESGVYYMGSGGDVALGALDALEIEKVKTAEEAEVIIQKAIAIAIKRDIYCAEPIHTYIQRAPATRKKNL